jgi:Uma2 family endonuclease
VRTVVSDPPPAEFEALLERRRRLGLDRWDEIWDGELHMNRSPHGRHSRLQVRLSRVLGPLADSVGLTMLNDFNLGDPDNYRIPDGGLQRSDEDQLYYPTAALAIEIVSPGDETWNKLDHYAAHGVDELLIVDPLERTVDWLGLRDGSYEPIERSALIDLGAADLAEQLEWPEA